MTGILCPNFAIARRNNFLEMFEPLYRVDRLKTGLLDGNLTQLRVFTELVLPLILAKKKDDEFKVAQIIRKSSPLLKPDILKEASNQIEALKNVSYATKELYSLWEHENDPSILEVLTKVDELKLFTLPDSLLLLIQATQEEIDGNEIFTALQTSFTSSFSQLKAYKEYISGESKFETHQGVKGLEYPRVMVIIDDSESRGFLFSYDKLFGSKELTKRDLDNMDSGIETGIDRTRRLFYVACSRAKESLAVVVYTDSPETIKKGVIKNGWFNEGEIELVGS